jgi:hypothetical protein
MSRWLLEDNSGLSRRAESAEAADGERAARGGASDHDARGAGIPRLRDDPAGRRSLTGLEFRRLRSQST